MADKMFGISLRDQRVKWLVVAGLAAVLLAVIVWPGQAPPPADSATTAGTRQGGALPRSATAAGQAAGNIAVKTAKNVGKKSRSRRNVAAAPRDELETTLSFNPFASRTALQPQVTSSETAANDPRLQQARDELAEKARALAIQERLSRFRDQKISVLLRTTDGGSAAMIGDRLVREGDVVDGIRVLSISADAVVLEAADQE